MTTSCSQFLSCCSSSRALLLPLLVQTLSQGAVGCCSWCPSVLGAVGCSSWCPSALCIALACVSMYHCHMLIILLLYLSYCLCLYNCWHTVVALQVSISWRDWTTILSASLYNQHSGSFAGLILMMWPNHFFHFPFISDLCCVWVLQELHICFSLQINSLLCALAVDSFADMFEVNKLWNMESVHCLFLNTTQPVPQYTITKRSKNCSHKD